MNTEEHGSVLLTGKSFARRKGIFLREIFALSRLRGESRAGLSPRRREAREENAKDFSLVAALLLCVHPWFRSYFLLRLGWTVFIRVRASRFHHGRVRE